MRRTKMSNLYNDTTNALLNAIDIQKTIESNNLNNIKRVHSGTANEDTLEDLINDVVSFLENLTEQLKENENELYNIMLIWKDRNVKNPEDPTDEWLVRDLLCDLKHFCDEYAIDFDSELSRANNLYLKENEDDT
jgi:hypothetical protein